MEQPARGWTPKFVEAIRSSTAVFEIADPKTPGLVLRVHPSGVKSFRWYVRGPDWRRAVTIGPWSMKPLPAHCTLDEAREWLRRLKHAHAAGVDRLEVECAQLQSRLTVQRGHSQPGDAGTVGQVAERFLRSLEGRRKRPDEARYVYEKDIAPFLGARPLMSIKKSDCRAVIAKVTERGAKVHAGKVLGLMKQLLDYAENVEDDFLNPAARLKASNLEIEHNVRDRWLSEDEIAAFWWSLDHADGAPETGIERKRTGAALRLLLLTAARSGELRLTKWEHLKFKESTWTIPVEAQKLSPKQARTAKPFVIPLTPTAREIFETLHELAGDSEWVLPTTEGKRGANGESATGHYGDKTLGKAMRRHWRAHPDLKALPEASPHDLRRTARTHLGKLGVAPHIAERCLNHRLGKLIATYDLGDYLDERRAALEKWDRLILRLTA